METVYVCDATAVGFGERETAGKKRENVYRERVLFNGTSVLRRRRRNTETDGDPSERGYLFNLFAFFFFFFNKNPVGHVAHTQDAIARA